MSTLTADGRTLLTYDEAVAMLPDGDQIHTFVDGGIMLAGADWKRDQILALLAVGAPETSGAAATERGHGLVAFRPDGEGHVFIATREVTADSPTG